MNQKIKATFTTEKARWYHKINKYVDRTFEIEDREIKMEIIAKDSKEPILRFVGGPTGFEAYYISSLLQDSFDGPNFCICGGTVNSWPQCEVPWAEVKEFLKSNGYEREI